MQEMEGSSRRNNENETKKGRISSKTCTSNLVRYFNVHSEFDKQYSKIIWLEVLAVIKECFEL